MAKKCFTDKYRKRMKRLHTKARESTPREQLEAKAYYAYLTEQRNLREAQADELRKHRKMLVDSLASLYWQKRYQENPEAAQRDQARLKLCSILKAIGCSTSMFNMYITAINFEDSEPTAIDPFLFCDMHQL